MTKSEYHHIYGLTFNIDDMEIVFYVGHTNDLERRQEEHLANAVNPRHAEYNTEKYRWCRSLREQGLEYALKPLALFIEQDEDSEYEWILRQARENIKNNISFYNGEPLCNMKAGDLLREIMANRSINTSKQIKEYRQRRAKSLADKRTFQRGEVPQTERGKQIMLQLQKMAEQRRAIAEEQQQRQQIQADKYAAMMADPQRQEKIRIETIALEKDNLT
jgi:predicted GIY-YIG superfamily endonuclease